MNSFALPQTLVALPFAPPLDDLYSRVFEAILEQQIHSASRFTEESLAQMFGARRSEIRNVLTRLSLQQIVILRVNHRPRVAVPDADQTRQILHARRLAEITLVRLACQQPHARDIKHLRELIDGERQCAERGRAILLSGTFHLRLAEMAGNAPLAHFLESLVPLTSLVIAQQEEPTRDYCAWPVHERIVEAVERRDAANAVTLLSRHLDDLEQMLLNPPVTLRQNRIAG
jgi:DNA-binding GntR family transcriptional regulator